MEPVRKPDGIWVEDCQEGQRTVPGRRKMNVIIATETMNNEIFDQEYNEDNHCHNEERIL